MKLISPASLFSFGLRTLLGSLIVAALIGNVRAQSVVPAPPPFPPALEVPTPPAPPDTNGTTTEISAPVITPSSSTPSPGATSPAWTGSSTPRAPLQWRNVVFKPHVTYRFVYGTGIPLHTNVSKTNVNTSARQSKDTVIQTFSPGMLVALGDHWTVDYTPSLVIYSDSEFDNVVNHLASLGGQTTYEDWNFGLNASANLTSDPQTETGTQTEQQSYNGAFTASRALSGSLSMDLSARVNVRETEAFANSRDYSTLNWLNQQIGPNIGIGLGLGGGYRDVDEGTDSTYEQVRGRFLLNLTGKISLSLNAGAEIQQYVGQDGGSVVTPIFGASLRYQPFEPTAIRVSADRSVGSSYFENQTTETTTLSVELSQRFLRRLNASLQGGYTLNSFRASTADAEIGREDTHTFVMASLGTAILKRGSVMIFYTHSENVSDESNFDYSSDQYGVQLSYNY
jgi:hypothetical protein